MYYKPYGENDHKDPAEVDRIVRVLIGNMVDISEDRQRRIEEAYQSIAEKYEKPGEFEFIEAVNDAFAALCAAPDATQEDTIILIRKLLQGRIRVRGALFPWFNTMIDNYFMMVCTARSLIGS